MRDITADFRTEKDKKENRPICLYEIGGVPDDFKYLAEYDTDVVFGGHTYIKFPLKRSNISESRGGGVDTLTISISNVSREVQYYLENNDGLRGEKIRILQVWADHLAEPTNYIEDIFYIESTIAREHQAEFNLTSKFDVMEAVIPGRRLNRLYCQWVFKSDECGYTGVETSCQHTLEYCRILGNQKRCGCFPGVPGQRSIRL